MQKSGRRRQKSGGFGASLPWADSERCDNPPFGGRVSLQRGHIRCILLVDHNHYVFQLWSESQPRHRFLTILRRAANESDSTGRLPAAAGLGAGAAVWGPVGSECCRSFGLPAGLAHRDLFFFRAPYKYDPFVRFHAVQSILLSCFYWLLMMTWVMFVRVFFSVHLGFLLPRILASLYVLVAVGMILLSLFLMYKALRRQRFSLPFIGRVAAAASGE